MQHSTEITCFMAWKSYMHESGMRYAVLKFRLATFGHIPDITTQKLWNWIVFHISVKVKDFSQNFAQVGVLNQISEHRSLRNIMRRWDSDNLCNTFIEKYYLNHFNSHTCQLHAFMWKIEPVNVSKSFMLSSKEKNIFFIIALTH